MINLTALKTLVRLATVYNASAIIVFLTPGALESFDVREPYSIFWLWLPSLLGLFASDFDSSISPFITVLALGDLVLGLGCVLGLPYVLKRSHLALLTAARPPG